MAPWAGLEPATFRLTAERSTIELPGNRYPTFGIVTLTQVVADAATRHSCGLALQTDPLRIAPFYFHVIPTEIELLKEYAIRIPAGVKYTLYFCGLRCTTGTRSMIFSVAGIIYLETAPTFMLRVAMKLDYMFTATCSLPGE